MYISKLYREEDRAKIMEFLRQNEFATLVAYDGEKPVASHLLMEVVERQTRAKCDPLSARLIIGSHC